MTQSVRKLADSEIVPEDLAFFGRVRDFRAEIQNIQRITVEIRAKSEQAEPNDRAQTVKLAVQKNERIFRENSGQIEARLREIRFMLDKHVRLYDFYGDQIANIENAWHRSTLSWPKSESEPEQALHDISAAAKEFRTIVRSCGLLTIPNRVRQHLRQLRIGGALDFHEAFSDELPEADDRLYVLRYIHSHPTLVNGIVSLSDGLILNAAEGSRRRALSLGLIVGASLFGFAAVWAGCLFGVIQITSERNLSSLMQGYALVILGAIAHVLVDFLKLDRVNKGTTSGLQEWSLQIHVREVSFLQVAISLWVGFLFLAYSTEEPIDWETSFLLGYGIDSFLDLFLQRFATKVGSGTAALQANLLRTGAAPSGTG